MTTPLPTQFTESLRYDYPLTSSSLVIDAGGYHGQFAAEISRRYGCRVDVYEPVFHELCAKALESFPNVSVFPYGLADFTGSTTFHIKGDMTGSFADGPAQEVQMLEVSGVISDSCPVDLLKLNVEGMEYVILNRLLSSPPLMQCLRNIQVQFHSVGPERERLYPALRERLLTTHHLTFDFPWCWENYRRNEL